MWLAIPAAPYDPFGDNFPPRNEQFLQANMPAEWAESNLSNVHDGEIVVPPDKYFAMGDNRDHSWTAVSWGFVDRDAIMGRPVSFTGPCKALATKRRTGASWVAVELFGYADPSAVEDALAPRFTRFTDTVLFFQFAVRLKFLASQCVTKIAA